jgi:hypothetical protein
MLGVAPWGCGGELMVGATYRAVRKERRDCLPIEIEIAHWARWLPFAHIVAPTPGGVLDIKGLIGDVPTFAVPLRKDGQNRQRRN